MVLGSSPVAVTSPSDFMPASSKEFLDIQATIECGFTLKRVRDMTRTYRLLTIFSVLGISRTYLFKYNPKLPWTIHKRIYLNINIENCSCRTRTWAKIIQKCLKRARKPRSTITEFEQI